MRLRRMHVHVAGVAIFVCYVNQLTFFGSCIALHTKRVAAGRHCVTCLKTRSRRELKDDGKSLKTQLFCCGSTPKTAQADESLFEKYPSRLLPKLLMNVPAKSIVAVLYVVYLTISVIGTTRLQMGLKLEQLVPESSHLSRFLSIEHAHYPRSGQYVMLVVNEPVTYHNAVTQTEISRIFGNIKPSSSYGV